METQQGFTLWLTGMSGAGKSAVASYVARRFPLVGRRVELIDPSELGDLAPDAPDTPRADRDRTVRLLGWTAKLLTRNGVIPVVATVSPHREVRDEQRRQIGRFFEVMVECPLEVLVLRDTKGIYRRALAGEVDVVGVVTPYEPPQLPEAVVDMATGDVAAAAKEIFEKLAAHGYITRQERDVLVNGSAGAEETAVAGKAPKGKAKAEPASKGAGTKGAKSTPKVTAKEPKAAATAKAPATETKAAGKAKASAKETKAAPKAKAPVAESKAAAKAKAPATETKAAARAKAPAAASKAAPKAKAPAAGSRAAAKANAPEKAKAAPKEAKAGAKKAPTPAKASSKGGKAAAKSPSRTAPASKVRAAR